MHLLLSAASSDQISFDQESSRPSAAAVAVFLVPPRFVRRPLMKLSSAGVPQTGERSKGRGRKKQEQEQ